MMQGYLKTEKNISEDEVQRIRFGWGNMSTGRNIKILPKGIEFVSPNHSALDPSIIVCGHCGQWAAVQTECKHCGAAVF